MDFIPEGGLRKHVREWWPSRLAWKGGWTGAVMQFPAGGPARASAGRLGDAFPAWRTAGRAVVVKRLRVGPR